MALYIRLEHLQMGSVDPETEHLIELEKGQQCKTIQLTASDQFTSSTVNEALGFFQIKKKYSELNPGNHCYGGKECINKIVEHCGSRALDAYSLNPTSWGVIVRGYSGSPALYTAILRHHDRIMGLDLPSGRRLTDRYSISGGKKIHTSISFESLPYEVNPSTGYIDYDQLEKKAFNFCPHLIICGSSAYPRDWDYARLCSIANQCGALLLCDMTHLSGLVATKEAADPFEFCDIVTTTTHRSLKCPRFAMIFYRKDPNPAKKGQLKDVRKNIGISPFVQGGMRKHKIGALAIALRLARERDFEQYAKKVKANAVALGNCLKSKDYKLVTDGTENHLVLWDLRPLEITGDNFKELCDHCNITVTKGGLFGQTDGSSLGVLIGTYPMTAVGCIEKDFVQIGEFLHQAVGIARRIQDQHGMLPQDFKKGLVSNEEIGALRVDVEGFAGSFTMPKYLMSEMTCKE